MIHMYTHVSIAIQLLLQIRVVEREMQEYHVKEEAKQKERAQQKEEEAKNRMDVEELPSSVKAPPESAESSSENAGPEPGQTIAVAPVIDLSSD